MDSQESDVFNQVLDTMDSAVVAIEAAELAKTAALAGQAALVTEFQEKLANAKYALFPREQIDQLVDKLATLGAIPPGNVTKVANHLAAHPETMLSFMDRVSDTLVAPPSEGFGVPKAATNDSSSDPDGWNDYLAGRPVKLRR